MATVQWKKRRKIYIIKHELIIIVETCRTYGGKTMFDIDNTCINISIAN